MKKTLLAPTVFLVATAAMAAQVVEAIVIRVGDRVVTRTQYEKRLREGLAEIDQAVAHVEWVCTIPPMASNAL